MDVHGITALSGLSRGQVDQLVSRHGMQPQGEFRRGHGRVYTPADAFAFVVAGRLLRLGMAVQPVASALSTIVYQVDPSTFEPVEIFPGHRAAKAEGHTVLLVLRIVNGDLDADFLSPEHFAADLARGGSAAAVINATAVAELVEASWSDEGR